MQNKTPIIIIAVLSVMALGLGYWYGLPKKGAGKATTPNKTDPSGKVLPANGELIADPALRKELARILKIEEGKITQKQLSELTSLNLHGKGIKSIEGLQHCIALKSLDLQFNKIEDLGPIAKLDKLEALDLGDNPGLERVPDLSALKKVKKLRFTRCAKLRDISGLKEMTWLESLGFHGAGLKDISPIAGLVNLKSLDLQFNKIEDLGPIVNMGKLEGLDLSENPVLERLPDLSALKKVKTLRILRCAKLRDISGLKGITWLESLTLYALDLKDISPIAGLVNLKSLDLQNNKIEDLSPIARLVNLKSLNLQYNKIEDLSPIVNMDKLDNLYLDNNLIQKVPDLSKLIYITTLSFQNNHLRDISGLKAMDGLQTLNITNNPLLGDLAPLTGLKRLKSLTAPNCKITNTTHLRLMKSLQSLDIQGNTIPQPELQTLKTALPGCKILPN